jgi:hypothetical protein
MRGPGGFVRQNKPIIPCKYTVQYIGYSTTAQAAPSTPTGEWTPHMVAKSSHREQDSNEILHAWDTLPWMVGYMLNGTTASWPELPRHKIKIKFVSPPPPPPRRDLALCSFFDWAWRRGRAQRFNVSREGVTGFPHFYKPSAFGASDREISTVSEKGLMKLCAAK